MSNQVIDGYEQRCLNDLYYNHRCIATIQIETSDDTKNSKFILGSFFIWSYSKKCYFIEKNETVFFDKILKYSKEIGKPITCFFKSDSFNSKFLMRYCSKKLNISPEIEQIDFRTYAIRLLKETKDYHDNTRYGDMVNYTKTFDKLSFKDIDLSLEKYPFDIDDNNNISLIKPNIKTIDIKSIREMINSKDKKLIKKGYKILKEKINFDTYELFLAITPYHKNYYMMC